MPRPIIALPLRLAMLLLGLSFANLPVANPAQAAGNGCSSAIPDCELQEQAPISYSALQTKGWAYSCGGTKPYFWGAAQAGVYYSFSWDNSCFTVAENSFAETNPSKFDATITNWCLKSEKLTISLACSDTPAPSACTGGKAQSDPQCPILGSIRNTCQGVVCVQSWNELCNETQLYSCVADLPGVNTCIPCNGN